MNVHPHEGPNYLVDNATPEMFLEAFKDEGVSSASPHKAGSRVKANGGWVEVDNKGCWKKLDLVKGKRKRKAAKLSRRKNR